MEMELTRFVYAQGELILDLIHEWFKEFKKDFIKLEAERQRQNETLRGNEEINLVMH
jgi:hypothetical protein